MSGKERQASLRPRRPLPGREANRRSSEHIAADLLPTCACGDVADYLATVCGGCGRRLYEAKR